MQLPIRPPHHAHLRPNDRRRAPAGGLLPFLMARGGSQTTAPALAGLLVTALLIVAIYTIGVPAGLAGKLVADAIFLVTSSLVLFTCLRAWRRLGPAGHHWLFVSLGCLTWVAGGIFWVAHELILRTQPSYPSLADIGYLLFPPLCSIGLILVIRRRREGGPPTLELVLDTLLVMIASAAISYWLLLEPALAGPTTIDAALLVSLLWQAGTVSLLFLSFSSLVWRTDLPVRAPLLVLALGNIAFTIASIAYGRLAIIDGYRVGHPIDLGWYLGFLLITAAAVLAGRRTEDHHATATVAPLWSCLPRTAITQLSVLVTTGLAIGAALDPGTDPEIAVSLGALGVLVSGRLLYAARQAWQLAERTRERNRLALEAAAAADLARVNEALRTAEARYRALVEQIPAVVYLDPRDGSDDTAFVSPRIADLLGYHATDLDGIDALWAHALDPGDQDGLQEELARTTASGDRFSAEYRLRHRDGHVVWVSDESVRVYDDASDRWSWQGVLLDISTRKQLEAELSHQAFHDPLTGLANRARFNDRIAQALAHPVGTAGSTALLFIDLDDFKVVNDSLGHRAGDDLLVTVARRLRACVREGDTLARVGGDEFTLLLLNTDLDAARQVAQRIGEELRAPIDIDGHLLVITPSLGIAVSRPNDRAEDLLRRADVALYEAKQQGKDRFSHFEEGMDVRVWSRFRLESDLRHAIDRDEFRLDYQPLVELASGRVVELEALVRWEHPTRGRLEPTEFISLAEETGLIVPLGRWVLNEACRQLAAWRESGACAPDLAVSVNISPRQLAAPDLVGDVERALRAHRLDPALLQLEFSEHAALDDMTRSGPTLRALDALGVRLAIDDFGAGNAALSYLRRCPIDMLKIDRTYVAGLLADHGDEAIVRAIIAFARSLGLGVTAKGIETAAQLDRLRSLGCDLGQGFHVARPAAPDDHAARLRWSLDGSGVVPQTDAPITTLWSERRERRARITAGARSA